MFIKRRKTKQIRVGSVLIGGGAPVVVQSMTTPDTADVKATVEQIHQLEQVGCEIVRVTVNTPEAAKALPAIKKQTTIPIIADIHFDHRLALQAAEVVDCVRINPGNIGAWWKVEEGCRMGGFGSAVLESLSEQGIANLPTKVVGLPDQYVEQGPQELLRAQHGLTADGIYEEAKDLLTKVQVGERF